MDRKVTVSDNAEILLELDCISALTLLASIQLALRHPDNHGPSADIAREIGASVEKSIVQIRPDLAVLCAAGWSADNDDRPLTDFVNF